MNRNRGGWGRFRFILSFKLVYDSSSTLSFQLHSNHDFFVVKNMKFNISMTAKTHISISAGVVTVRVSMIATVSVFLNLKRGG